jgi:hypothetical protein
MGRFLDKLMGAPEVKALLNDEHFSLAGTLLQVWASYASLKPIDGEDNSHQPYSGAAEVFCTPKTGRKREK